MQKQQEQEEQAAKSQPQPEEKMENNGLEPQNMIPIPVIQVGYDTNMRCLGSSKTPSST